METLIHALVALPLALLILWLSQRAASVAVQVIGIVGAVVAFAAVFIGSYWVFCTSCT
jgi:hypothetical protein